MATQINFTSQGKTIAADVYAPTGSNTTGLVVVAYGSDGLTDDLSGPWETMIRNYAESLIQSGFIPIIPDYFGVTGTSPGPAVFDSISQHRDKWQTAISDAINHAKLFPMADASRIGLLGFSLGGHLCLRLRDKAKVLVEYFAPVFDGIDSVRTLTHAQIHHGNLDGLVDISNSTTVKTALDREGTATESFQYDGAGHGFIGNDQANSDARTHSKERTLKFFQTHL